MNWRRAHSKILTFRQNTIRLSICKSRITFEALHDFINLMLYQLLQMYTYQLSMGQLHSKVITSLAKHVHKNSFPISIGLKVASMSKFQLSSVRAMLNCFGKLDIYSCWTSETWYWSLLDLILDIDPCWTSDSIFILVGLRFDIDPCWASDSILILVEPQTRCWSLLNFRLDIDPCWTSGVFRTLTNISDGPFGRK